MILRSIPGDRRVERALLSLLLLHALVALASQSPPGCSTCDGFADCFGDESVEAKT